MYRRKLHENIIDKKEKPIKRACSNAGYEESLRRDTFRNRTSKVGEFLISMTVRWRILRLNSAKLGVGLIIMKQKFYYVLIAVLFITRFFCFDVTAKEFDNLSFYINSNDLDRLYCVRSNGTGLKRLSDRIVDRAWETKSYIYFTVSEDECFPAPCGKEEYGLFRIKKDGTNEIFIERFDTSIWDFLFNDNYVCFYDDKLIRGYKADDYENQDGREYYDREKIYVSDDVLKTLAPKRLSDNYVYFTDKNNLPYRIFFHENGNPNKPVKINKLPSPSQKELPVKATDRFCEKSLMWNEVKNAERYIISKQNSETGRYVKIAETTKNKITFEVPSKELNTKYKVTACAGNKYYKTTLTENIFDENFIGFSSRECFYKGKLYRYEKRHWTSNKPSGIHVYDFVESEPKLIYEGEIDELIVYDDRIYCNYLDQLFTIDLNGKNKVTVTEFDELHDNESVHESQFMFTDKAVYVKYVEDIFDEDHGDSLIRYDFESGSQSKIIEGEPYSPDYYLLVCYVNDKIVYKYKEYLCTVDKMGNRRFTSKPDNYGQFYNGKFYFNDNGLCSINFDGSCFKRYFTPKKFVADYIIYDNMLYYIKGTNYKWHIYRCSLDGRNDEIIVKDDVDDMYIESDYLYYTLYDSEEWLRVDLY